MKTRLAILLVLFATLALAAMGDIAWSQEPVPIGDEFQVNTYTTERQTRSAVASNSEGAFVAVWESYYQDGSGRSIQGQRYAANGMPSGGEFQVNGYTTNDQSMPAVASDAAGNFVVLWTSQGQDGSSSSVQGRRYDSDGLALAVEFQVNTYTSENQALSAVASRDNGEFVAVWASYRQDGSGWSIQGQRYDTGGMTLAGEFQVNTYTTSHQYYPAVAMDAAGDFVVVWQSSTQDGSYNSIQGQRYDRDGLLLGAEFQVNTYTTDHQKVPAVAAADDGSFVVVWQSLNQDGSSDSIQGQRYDSNGALVGDEFQVNSYTTSFQVNPAVAAVPDGAFMVTWAGPGPDSFGVQARWYDSAGTSPGVEFRVDSFVGGGKSLPAVASADTQDFVVVWTSNNQDGSSYSVHGQRFATPIFSDGFESGDTSVWSSTQ